MRVAVLVLVFAFVASAHAQVPAGGEFQVNTYTAGRQWNAYVSMDRTADFVVVWASNGQDGSQYGIFGQRLAADGSPRGGEFRINSYTMGSQVSPQVASGGRKDFVVVWGSAQDGSGTSVQGQRFDRGGDPIGGEFSVNTTTLANQYNPNLGRAADGRFVVNWMCETIDGSAVGIAGRRFDESGNPLGADFVVNTYTTGFQRLNEIAVAPDGSFVAVWADANPGDPDLGVFGQRFDAAGSPAGVEFLVNTNTLDAQFFPAVGVAPDGRFTVVWEGRDGSQFGTFAQRFDAAGTALGGEFRVNLYTTGNQRDDLGRIATDAAGNFVVTWSGAGIGDGGGVFGQRFTASGARRGPEFRVNTYITGFQQESRVSSDEVGNFVVAWIGGSAQDGSDYGIFAQRFGGLGPAALAVDTTGNAVLEPGETVDFRPTWRNFNGAAQAFSGVLSDIVGPSGAVYAIVDDGGDYGAVANGVTGACVDCYAVSVSNPAVRPAIHWDASVLESILPDAQGQQKRWLLHVGESFTDVPRSSPFYRFVETLLHWGVSGGCSGTLYCPASTTSREQMAVFVLIAKEGAGYAPPACVTAPVFADVPASSAFCPWIEELARRGVVAGCGGGNYCPIAAITREQMAVYVLRTLESTFTPPACTAPLYADVPAPSAFCPWIEELTRRSVVTGCGGGNYCPAASVTREQMGVFISATFGLMLYGP